MTEAVKPEAKQPMTMATLMSSLASVFKAIPNDKLDDLKDVVDMWNEPGGDHKNPSRAQIVTGPAQRASGDGAPKMIAEYASPAPQEGMTAQYAEFQRMMDGWGKSFSEKLAAQLNPVLARHDTALKGMLTVFEQLHKSQTPAAPGADTFLGKALQKISKGKLALRKAEMSDDDEKEERKSYLTDAKDMLKSAKRLLAKAMEDMEDTDDEGCEKAMTSAKSLLKAVEKAEKEDDEKEKDAAEKAKTAAATLKATEDAAAATLKAETEAAEKAKTVTTDTAVKAVTQEQIEAALKGMATLPTTMQGLLDAVMGKSQNPIAPEIAKGVVVDLDFQTRVDEAIDSGRLGDNGEMKALSLLQHAAAVKAGRLDQTVFAAEVEKAPAEIRALFQAAA